MRYSKILLATCTWFLVSGYSLHAAAQTTTAPTKEALNAYGRIIFYEAKDPAKEICSLAIPETKGTYDFSASTQLCENNRAASFSLENVPSATLIQFYDKDSCTDAQSNDNFYFKLKTVKQPTDWSQVPNPAMRLNFNALRDYSEGALVPGKNIRVEKNFVGSNYSSQNLDERLSCVYIERSQPVN